MVQENSDVLLVMQEKTLIIPCDQVSIMVKISGKIVT
jgi:hypothetical protein